MRGRFAPMTRLVWTQARALRSAERTIRCLMAGQELRDMHIEALRAQLLVAGREVGRARSDALLIASGLRDPHTTAAFLRDQQSIHGWPEVEDET